MDKDKCGVYSIAEFLFDGLVLLSTLGMSPGPSVSMQFISGRRPSIALTFQSLAKGDVEEIILSVHTIRYFCCESVHFRWSFAWANKKCAGGGAHLFSEEVCMRWS